MSVRKGDEHIQVEEVMRLQTSSSPELSSLVCVALYLAEYDFKFPVIPKS